MKSKLLILFFAFISIYIFFNRGTDKDNMFRWDATGYYLYLPAIFIYHDLGQFHFYPDLNKKYNFTMDANAYGMYDQPTGRRMNKYAIGTALFELPFFLVAHTYCLLTHAYDADGYTYPYQLAGVFSFILWVTLGLLFLRNFLARHFNDNITFFTLLCIAFGTNIYCYTIFNPGMSHPIGFFLFAGILYCTDALYICTERKYFYWLGLLLGLVIITRPVNIVVAILPLFWQVYNKETLMERFKFFSNRIKDIAIGFFIFFMVSLIQMAYWKYTSGDWIHYSYQGEGFNFLRPHIVEGLFSYQKGWFIYTPIAFVSMAALVYFWIKERKSAPVIFVFFAIVIYVVFSWRQWWYGGGFSARALIETLPIASFPLAFLFQQIFYAKKGIVKKIAFAVVMIFFVVLNLFQTYQYSFSTIHYVLMNRAYYWKIFGKVKATDEDYKLKMTNEEYCKEIEDCNRK